MTMLHLAGHDLPMLQIAGVVSCCDHVALSGNMVHISYHVAQIAHVATTMLQELR